jgi:hypothetical protein
MTAKLLLCDAKLRMEIAITMRTNLTIEMGVGRDIS